MKKNVVIWVAVAVLGLIVVTALGLFVADPDRRVGAINQSSYAVGSTLLEIDGVAAGFLKSATGCASQGDVVNATPGADGIIRKHTGAPRHEPCVIEVTSAMGKPAYDWIRAMLNGNALQKNVTLIIADYQYKEKSRLQLQNTLLTGLAFPALSPADKDPATIQLTLQPEVIQRSTANAGTSIQGAVGTKPKAWMASNYRVTMSGGLPATKVASISSLEVTQKMSQDSVGEERVAQKVPTKLELGNVTVSVTGNEPPAWDAWFHSFVVQGNNSQADEKTATIELLDSTLKNVLATFTLKGVGIFRAGALPSDEKTTSSSYSLYVEEAEFSSTLFSSTAGATAPAPPPSTTTPPPPPPATTTEATILSIAATKLQDGETFTISDGTNEPTTFEFDFDGRFGAAPVKVAPDAPAEEVAGAIVEAINSVEGRLELTAKLTGETQIQLVSARAEAEGEEKILEFVEDESFKVQDKVVERAPEGLPAPAGLTATTGGEGEVKLSWNEAPGALAYLILFRTEKEGEYLELDKTEGTEIALRGLDPGVTHYFVVRALDGAQESANSTEAAAAAG